MDRRATILSLALPPLVLAGFVLGYLSRSYAGGAYAPVGDRVREAAAVVKERYYGEVPPEELEKAAVSGMMTALDPYCEYFTKKEYDDFYTRQISGRFGGVGVEIEMDRDTGYLTIISPIEDTPAFSADVLPGDKIIRVDGEDMRGRPQNEVVERVKGPEGTRVTLTLYRAGREPFDVPLTRAKIEVRAVKWKMLDDGIGYVRISSFTEMLPQFDRAVSELRGKGMSGLVLDLRFNGGGLLESSVELSDRFLRQGTLIVSTRGRMPRDYTEKHAKDDSHDVPSDLPVAIIVNGSSASASEVFAGCLRDHGRAALVGSRTYGKGSVQTAFKLSDGSHVKVTTARYFTPDGTSVHREPGKKDYGLDPDYVVDMTPDEYMAVRTFWRREGVLKGTEKPEPAKDLQLDAAVEVVKAGLEKREPKVSKRELAVKKDD